ncbi:MAG TPA: 50S ribosomal protein L11 methyltransferase, partial [Egibacteraceae bacterium]
MTDTPHSPPAWALHTDVDSDTVNLHLARLEALGLLGLAEVDGRTTVYVSRRDDSLPLRGRWEPVPDRDWNAEWRRSIQPVTVGAVTIVPPWLATGAAEELVIEPAQAFGTGHHETTTG